jgi:ribosomal peptide maturation radical SAM protein 1
VGAPILDVPSPELRLVERPTPARRVALVCTPFHAVGLPSIALCTLAPLLRQQGHHVDVVHLNLDFAARLGVVKYETICSYNGWLRLLGEWLFADERVAPGAVSVDEYGAYLRSHPWRDRARELERFDLGALRAEADAAVERWFRSRDWSGYDAIGFATMFQQINASLRLAYRIKSAFPRVRVVLGGSAMEVPMGQPVLDRHPWIDAVFSGYAERSFPEYVANLPPRLDRVVTQEAPFDIEKLPVPDYRTFFEEVASAGLSGAADFRVPIETSRGCWWGEKQHCIFCGLNALDMKQRSKSAARVFAEVVEQSRYRLPFFATDNILPLEFFKGLFDRLIAAGVPFDTFYETKSNLSLAQLRTLQRAGVTALQPGIESLSTPVLKHMKKGVSAAQNLWILRAAAELGIDVAWSILYGFPEEAPEEYERITALLPALSHLPAPLRPAPVLLERYSPLFDKAAAYGLTGVRPTRAHEVAFGHAPALDDRAYVFDFDYGDGRKPDTYTRRLNEDVASWMAARSAPLSPRCEVFHVGGRRVVLDTRDPHAPRRGLPKVHVLTPAERELVRLTEELTDDRKLREAWTRAEAPGPLVDAFVRRRWIVRIDGRLVRVLLNRREPFLSSELRRTAGAGLDRAKLSLRRWQIDVAARATRALDRLTPGQASSSGFKSFQRTPIA